MIKALKEFLNTNKIRKRLILCFMLTTLFMTMTSVYTYYNAQYFIEKIGRMFISNVYLHDLNSIVNAVDQNLVKYLSTKHSENLSEYLKNSEGLKQKADEISRDFSTNENSLIIKDIKNMIYTYLAETDAAVNAKRGRNIYGYVKHCNEANKIRILSSTHLMWEPSWQCLKAQKKPAFLFKMLLILSGITLKSLTGL